MTTARVLPYIVEGISTKDSDRKKKNKQQEPNVGEWRVREGPGRVCGSQRPLGRGADVW